MRRRTWRASAGRPSVTRRMAVRRAARAARSGSARSSRSSRTSSGADSGQLSSASTPSCRGSNTPVAWAWACARSSSACARPVCPCWRARRAAQRRSDTVSGDTGSASTAAVSGLEHAPLPQPQCRPQRGEPAAGSVGFAEQPAQPGGGGGVTGALEQHVPQRRAGSAAGRRAVGRPASPAWWPRRGGRCGRAPVRSRAAAAPPKRQAARPTRRRLHRRVGCARGSARRPPRSSGATCASSAAAARAWSSAPPWISRRKRARRAGA